jgi:DNA-binding CsgD family transcriptional regulator
MTEFDVVFLAKAKDKMAVEYLWEKYKGGMTSILRFARHLTRWEQESETFLVLEKILEYINLEKVYDAWTNAGKDIALWDVSWLLSRRLMSLRNRLIRQSIELNKEETTFIEVRRATLRGMAAIETSVLPAHIATKYSPETLFAESLKTPLEKKEAELNARLSPYQKEILGYRRKGLTLKQIAKQTGVTTGQVRYRLNRAKALAREIFQVAYA